jgi:hypothetical protein
MSYHTILTAVVYSAALIITLALSACLTPASWWKRFNLRAAGVLAGGTWGIGALLLALAQGQHPGAQLVAALSPPPAQAAPTPSAAVPVEPIAGRSYQVWHDLNLRSGRGVESQRLAVVPVGSRVVTTGMRDGDWWQIQTSVGQQKLTGWASSLWLRRMDEMAPQL